MIVAIRITTARPHRARTHRLRYHGDGFSAAPNRSSTVLPMLKSCFEQPSTSYGGRLPPTRRNRIGTHRQSATAPDGPGYGIPP